MKVIITGSTGMVGKAVLLECLASAAVESVLLINRSPGRMNNPKIKEILHPDFADLRPISDHLKGYDACFYCLGVSALGKSEEAYFDITYTITETFAKTLFDHNPQMVFIYVSGAGTDGTEKAKIMWARVKGKTENMILNMGFKDAYAFRPGIILPEKGVKSRTGWYNAFYRISKPLFPLLRKMQTVITSGMMGKAMINAVLFPHKQKVLENKDIKILSEEAQG